MTYPQQYAPQQPYAPAYPQQPYQPPAQQYPPQQSYQQPYAPAYPQQPVQQAPAPAPLPAGSLDDFYGQPSGGGGPAFKFMDANTRQPMIGKWYAGIVARPITDGDVRAQTDQTGRAMTYKDGRPKLVMVVPMQVEPSPEFPDGVAGWWVKGQARDELARAMAEAGAPAGPPEPGAGIRVTLTGTRNIPNMNPQYLYRVEYMRPQGAVRQLQGQDPGAVPPVQQPIQAPPVQSAPPVQQVPVQQVPAQPAPQQTPVQQAPAQPAPQQTPAGFTPEQAELWARLSQGQQAA